MRTYAAWSVLGLCIVFSGCNSKDLSRSKAGALLTENFNGSRPITERLSVGFVSAGTRSLEEFSSRNTQVGDAESHFPVFTGRWFKAVADKGLIRMSWAGQGPGGGIVKIELTEEGKKYIVGHDGPFPLVKLCKQQFESITGITMLEARVGNVAKVEYTWKNGDFTPFEEAEMATTKLAKCDEHIHSASVTMQLYDDGWRLSQ